MSKLLDIKNLSVDFNVRDTKFRAVDSINLSLDKNETMALVGESGSGKSVTAMSILQLLPELKSSYSKESSIYFNGTDILNASKSQLRSIRGNQVSMIFQEPMTSLNPYHKVGKQIMESSLLHSGLSRSEAEKEAKNLKPDFFFVTPWGFIKEFINREKKWLNSGGKFILPFPKMKIIGKK